MVDLHCHSYFSDGTHSPLELLQMATQAKIELLALTDHDTVSGLESLHRAVKECNSTIKIINGIELSCRWKKYELHVLGLNIDLNHPSLLQFIENQHQCRQSRAQQISHKLEQVGVEDAYDKARVIAGHDNIARPHFAKVLMNEGFTTTIQSGFDRWLGRGKRAYVPTFWGSVESAIDVINQSGGDAVLAHPLKYQLTKTKLRELLTLFKEAGGAGIEVVSGECTKEQIGELAGLCEKFNLMASCGSDFHGKKSSRIKLGQQKPLPVNCVPVWHKWTN